MLFLIELYLQLTEIELAYHELNPKVGKKIQNNAKILMLKDGFYLGKSNEFGYLGPAYPREKKENVFRIALMGDSFTEGFQLLEKYHFRHIMEEQLNKSNKKDVQVLNFGVGGFDFSDMYIYYLNVASTFNPDLVIFIVRPNDIVIEEKLVPAPYVSLKNNELEINYDFRESNRYKLYQKYKFFIDNSSYFKMLNNIFFLIKRGMLTPIIFDKLYTYFYAPDQSSQEIMSVNTEKAMNRAISKIFPRLEVTKKMIDDLGKKGNVYFVYRADFPENIDNYIINSGIKTVSLDPPLKALKKEGIDPIYWKVSRTRGHWNHQAHRAIGEYLAKIIGTSVK